MDARHTEIYLYKLPTWYLATAIRSLAAVTCDAVLDHVTRTTKIISRGANIRWLLFQGRRPGGLATVLAARVGAQAGFATMLAARVGAQARQLGFGFVLAFV